MIEESIEKQINNGIHFGNRGCSLDLTICKCTEGFLLAIEVAIVRRIFRASYFFEHCYFINVKFNRLYPSNVLLKLNSFELNEILVSP